MKIAILGGGNMGGAIASGIVCSAVAADKDVVVSHPRAALLDTLEKAGHSIITTTDNVAAVKDADIIFLAMKPWLAPDVIDEIAPVIDPQRQSLASVVAGMTFDTMASHFTQKGLTPPPMYRVIPNTAISLAQSATFICGKDTREEHDTMIECIFSPLGKVFYVEESDMTAVTALASCGIAYILRYIDAAMRGGEEMGIDSKKSLEIVLQTVRGAVALLEERGTLPQEEIDRVTTPGGITLKGLEEMERCGFSAAVISGLKKSR